MLYLYIQPMLSKMLVSGSNRRSFGIDAHIGAITTGFTADSRQLVNRARSEASSYKESYGVEIVPSVLASRVGMFVHYYTTHGALRPFGSAMLIAGFDADLKTHELYMVEPSGLTYRYFGCAAGKGANAAKTEIEKLLSRSGQSGVSCRDAIKELARILYTIRDPSKDRPFELEMAWLAEENGYKYSHVPANLLAEADALGKSVQATGGTGNNATTSTSNASNASTTTTAGNAEDEVETPVVDMDTS